MTHFKDLGIKPISKTFIGDKIKMERILNREIQVHDFRMENSKYGNENSKCLYMQISIGETKHVLFTGSGRLIDLIERIPKTKFPFYTTIIAENKGFEFT